MDKKKFDVLCGILLQKKIIRQDEYDYLTTGKCTAKPEKVTNEEKDEVFEQMLQLFWRL